MTKIKCTFCSGTGKDPFDLLSPVSDCLVCNGSGYTEVTEPMKKCIFCSGSGKNPLGARITCIVCGGKGFNTIKGDALCNPCKGSGRATDGLPCTRCGGTGYQDR
jgi:DnaJ-class molecular chaperone